MNTPNYLSCSQTLLLVSDMLEKVKRSLTSEEINGLNLKYKALSVDQRVEELYKDFDAK